MTQEIVKAGRKYSDEQLRDLTQWEQVVKLTGSPIVPIGETNLSTGFDVVKDKQSLIGIPFIILDWRFGNGDNGEFVSILVITKDNRKLVINDGSTGIFAQMKELEDFEGNSAIGVAKGLRKSDYVRKDADGNPILNDKTGQPERATTYYLDTSNLV